jgi:hypothetical protein
MQYQEYANSMNGLADELSTISTRGGDQAREKARQELLAMLEKVSRFINSRFFTDDSNSSQFVLLATRRIQRTNEILTTKSTQLSRAQAGGQSTPSSGFPRNLLMKAQADIQEILNSAAERGATKASDFSAEKNVELNTGTRIRADLNMIANDAWKKLNVLDSRMLNLQLDDLLRQHKDQVDKRYKDADAKLKECSKRWNIVKNHCRMRDVAIYEEDPDQSKSNAGTPVMSGGGAIRQGPATGSTSKSGVTGAVKGLTSGVTGVASGVVRGVASGVMGVTTGIAKGVTSVVDGIQETFDSLGEDPADVRNSTNSTPARGVGGGATTTTTRTSNSTSATNMFSDDNLSSVATSAFKSAFVGNMFSS